MFGFDYTQLGAMALIAVGALGFAYQNRGAVGAFLSRFKPSGGTVPTVAVDDDTLDFQAHGRLQKRFMRLGCKEALDACTVQLQHFYHTEGHK
jgi:hypothetical protein